MVHLLKESPLLLLFVVAAAGFVLGRVKIGGFHLGVAGVLFSGLAIGALDPELKLPEIVSTFGLVLFVYTIGLSSGPGFFASFGKRGLRDNALALGVLALATGFTLIVARVLGFRAGHAAGMFAGASTNTPALAAVMEATKLAGASADPRVASDPIVAYSLAYPFGVVGTIVAIYVAQRLWKIDYDREPVSRRYAAGAGQRLGNATVRILRDHDRSPSALIDEHGLRVIFGRMERDGVQSTVQEDVRFRRGDLVSVVGTEGAVADATRALGEASTDHIDLDRSALDFRRIFVSNTEVGGRPLGELQLPARFQATLTRLRRGDVELLPDRDTVLELGDRVRVVAPRDRMEEVSKYLGDSYRAVAEIDVITFSLGIAAGLLVGLVPVPMPGGTTFRLGLAGGPLVLGLVLGRVGRSGPLVWTLPYSANLTLRQMGLVLFLAGVGTRSGYAFVSTLRAGGGLPILLAGAVLTTLVALTALFVGHRLLKIPMGVMSGTLAGIQTQPAVLAFASEQTKNDLPGLGYAGVYPLVTIAKILLAQLILVLVR